MERSNIVVRRTDPGGPESLTVEVEDVPAPGPSEVVIQTEYCAINYPDLLLTKNWYQLHPRVPFTLGSEAVGRVVECGSRVSSLSVGDVVHALTWHGAFTTHLVLDAGPFAPRDQAMRDVEQRVSPSTLLRAPLSVVPSDLPIDKVAAMGFVYSTAYYTLKDRAGLSNRQRLLVLGAAGGVGLAAVQIGKAMGADVVAGARTEDELELCRRYVKTAIECDQLLDEKWRRSEFKGDKRFDVVFDPLGTKYSEPALSTLRPGGRFLVIGFASEKEEEEKGSTTMRTSLVLLKECMLIGSAWGAWASRNPDVHVANFNKLYVWLRDGTIDPYINRVFTLAEAAQALSAMERKEIRGKVLLRA